MLTGWSAKSTRFVHRRASPMGGSDTHYLSGDDIRAGDRVRWADWTGVVVFVLGTGSFAPGYTPANWSYLSRGFMVDYDQAGLVFSEQSDEDLELLARCKSAATDDRGHLPGSA
jgi:hypothetical protein